MRIIILFILFLSQILNGQIIVDHRHVDWYDSIPQRYIDSIKCRWLSYAGESHSEGIRYGLQALENIEGTYAVAIQDNGTPASATTSNLRASRATWGDIDDASGWIYHYGEEDFWTSSTAVSRTKNSITYCNDNGYQLDYFGFGWCYDASYPQPISSGSYDPVYHVRWGGEALIGTASTGDYWGLDDSDNALCGGTVNMDDYLAAVVEYRSHCETNGYSTKVFFTTGTVDNEGSLGSDEVGYQQYLKWEYIRDYCSENELPLFDYADILCYNNSDELETTTWTDNNSELQTYPIIHDDNLSGTYVAHIGAVGALRLGKAMWVFLAMMEGWLQDDEVSFKRPCAAPNGSFYSVNGKIILID